MPIERIAGVDVHDQGPWTSVQASSFSALIDETETVVERMQHSLWQTQAALDWSRQQLKGSYELLKSFP